MTGVQTCALPIYAHPEHPRPGPSGLAGHLWDFSCFDSALRSIHAVFGRSDDFLSDSNLHRCAGCPRLASRAGTAQSSGTATAAPRNGGPSMRRTKLRNFRALSHAQAANSHHVSPLPTSHAAKRTALHSPPHAGTAPHPPKRRLAQSSRRQTRPQAARQSRRRASYPQIFPDLVARCAVFMRVSDDLMIFCSIQTPLHPMRPQ